MGRMFLPINDYLFPNSISRLAFLKEVSCVLCKVLSASVYITNVTLSLDYRAMVQAISRRTCIAEVQPECLLSPSEVCCGESSTGAGLSPSTFVFLCNYHSANVSYSCLSTFYPYQHKRVKRENVPFRKSTRVS